MTMFVPLDHARSSQNRQLAVLCVTATTHLKTRCSAKLPVQLCLSTRLLPVVKTKFFRSRHLTGSSQATLFHCVNPCVMFFGELGVTNVSRTSRKNSTRQRRPVPTCQSNRVVAVCAGGRDSGVTFSHKQMPLFSIAPGTEQTP